jgi:hypothetical protein
MLSCLLCRGPLLEGGLHGQQGVVQRRRQHSLPSNLFLACASSIAGLLLVESVQPLLTGLPAACSWRFQRLNGARGARRGRRHSIAAMTGPLDLLQQPAKSCSQPDISPS